MPQPMDPTTALMSAGADPNDVFQAMRQQEIAGAITGAALTPPQVQNYGAARSRISPLSSVSKLAMAMLANRAYKQSAQSMSNVYQQAYKDFQGPQGNQGDPNYQPAGQHYIPGMDPRSALNLYMTDPAKFAEKEQGPTAVQLYNYAHPEQGRNSPGQAVAASQALSKENMLSLRPNQTAVIDGRTYIAADPEHGLMYEQTGPGQFKAVPIADVDRIVRLMSYQSQAGKTEATPILTQSQEHPGTTNVQAPAQVGAPPPGTALSPPPVTGASPAGPAQPPAVGAGGTPPVALTAPQKGPPTFTASDLSAAKKSGEQRIDVAGDFIKKAEGATEVRRSLSELTNLSQGAPPGILNQRKLELGSYLEAMGASRDWLSAHGFGDISSLSAAAKQSGSLALNSIHDMTSRGTNFDLETFMKQNPNLNMADPQAFERVRQFIDAKMQNEIGKQSRYAQFLRGKGRPDDASDFTEQELQRDNAEIDKGRFQSNLTPKVYANEGQAQAARQRGEIKSGDKITIGGRGATWQD